MYSCCRSPQCLTVAEKPSELQATSSSDHFWQQILRYRHRTIALDNVRLVKLAMVDGFALNQTAVKNSWQHYLGGFLHGHLEQQQLFHKFDIASVIERAKHQHAFEYFADDQHSSLMLYGQCSLSTNLQSICLLSSVHQIEG